ncbi:MAG: ORF6N domain-containing protein [Candidatus Omnitrophota bacterium]
MKPDNPIIPIEPIEHRILFLRGHRVILDSDLADLYGVATKVLNQAIKRNLKRFPEDFMFQLTKLEKEEAVTICDRLSNLKFSTVLPRAFTEHGAIMAATILNSERAVEMSLFVVRAFVKLRRALGAHEDLARKLEALEKKYDSQFKIVFDAIRELMKPPEKPKRPIGFHTKE